MLTEAQVLRRPLVTERATGLADKHNQYAFRVSPSANKHQIRSAVESLYGVVVTKVRTMIVAGKLKRRGRSVGRRPNWKKAIVTLRKDDSIDFFGTE